MHAIELLAIVIHHVVVLPLFGTRGLTAPRSRSWSWSWSRATISLGVALTLGGLFVLGVAAQALVGTFGVDHFVSRLFLGLFLNKW